MERRKREENGGDGGVLRAVLEVILFVEMLRSSPFEVVHCTTIRIWAGGNVRCPGSEASFATPSAGTLNLILR
jgi:hypothetical protein